MAYLINYTLYRESSSSNEHYYVVIAANYEQAKEKFSEMIGDGGYINSLSLVPLTLF